ncbi:hypothetical protein, partial [Phocaeicola coprophilus]
TDALHAYIPHLSLSKPNNPSCDNHCKSNDFPELRKTFPSFSFRFNLLLQKNQVPHSFLSDISSVLFPSGPAVPKQQKRPIAISSLQKRHPVY